jgi:hypothetical protein
MVHDYYEVRNNPHQRRSPVASIDQTALAVRAFSP